MLITSPAFAPLGTLTSIGTLTARGTFTVVAAIATPLSKGCALATIGFFRAFATKIGTLTAIRPIPPGLRALTTIASLTALRAFTSFRTITTFCAIASFASV
jgi:hypothetical protein